MGSRQCLLCKDNSVLYYHQWRGYLTLTHPCSEMATYTSRKKPPPLYSNTFSPTERSVHYQFEHMYSPSS